MSWARDLVYDPLREHRFIGSALSEQLPFARGPRTLFIAMLGNPANFGSPIPSPIRAAARLLAAFSLSRVLVFRSFALAMTHRGWVTMMELELAIQYIQHNLLL
jgi:hypothetical protein